MKSAFNNNLTDCFNSLLLPALLLLAAGQNSYSQNLLIDASKTQNLAAIQSLLERQIDVNAVQGDGSAALHWSVLSNDIAISSLLLDHGADASATDDSGVSALSLASLNNSPQLVKLLLEAGADANVSSASGETPLMIAAHVGSTDIISQLLAAGADVEARENGKSQTALMFAVAENQLQATELLIANSALVNAQSVNKFTPLLFAAQKGNIEIAAMLLASGANVNDAAADGIAGNTNARWNLVPDTEASALLVAIDSGHEDMALFLLQQGANPGLDGAGRTALHSAVQHQMPAMVLALLERGADPNARLGRYMPVLSRVILIDNGMAVEKLGATAFFLAASYGDIELMELLTAWGADPLLTSDDGTTALMVAAGVDFVEGQDKYNRRWFADNNGALQQSALMAVAKCLYFGNDINARNSKNQTALHGAVYLGGTELISFLVENGANIDAINDRGQTPWMIADKGEYRAGSFQTQEVLASYLERLGADMTLGKDLGRYYKRDAREKAAEQKGEKD